MVNLRSLASISCTRERKVVPRSIVTFRDPEVQSEFLAGSRKEPKAPSHSLKQKKEPSTAKPLMFEVPSWE